jgi:O-antigen/teichoic acid export membrane protein
MGLVLYTRVSNSERSAEQNTMVLTAMRAAVAAALAVIILLLLVPDGIYRWVFGNEITGLTRLVLLMTPGLLAMAASQALSHFLSGTGRVVHNAAGSGIGALVTLALGYALIPTHGLWGAALTASGAYGASVLYQWLVFQRITGAGWRDLLPTGQDRQHLLTLWRQLSGR